MITLDARVTGIEAVEAGFDLAAEQVRWDLKLAVERASDRILQDARANVTGRILDKRTGRLADSLGSIHRETESSVYAKVGTDWYIGRFWERGFNGDQQVRAHLRAIKNGGRFDLKRITRSGKVRITKSYATGATTVGAHRRRVDGSPRPWLRPALEAAAQGFRREAEQIARKDYGPR
jgi:hypothetical protein